MTTVVVTPVMPVGIPKFALPVVVLAKLMFSVVITNGRDETALGERCSEMAAVTGGRGIRGRYGQRGEAGAKDSGDQSFHTSLLEYFYVYRTTCESRQRFRTYGIGVLDRLMEDQSDL